MEIRQKLAAMTASGQNKYFDQYGDSLPAEVTTAILEMPLEFCGVSESRRNEVLQRALEAQHGPEIAEISELEQGIEAAENWVEGSRNEVRLEAGVADERQFNEMAAPIETKHDAPWLRSGKDETDAEIIRVVIIEGLSGRRRRMRSSAEYFTQATNTTKKGKQHDTASRRQGLKTPVDPAKDQVAETRRILREMNDKADRAIDEQTGRRAR